MPLTAKERDALFEIQKDVALLLDWRSRQEETHEKLKIRMDSFEKTMQNGLLSKVNSMYDWINEQKLAAVKLDGEIKILGFKTKAETRQGIIIGGVTLLANIIYHYVTKAIP